MSDRFLSVAIPRPLGGLFTYRVPEDLVDRIHVGGWVKVPFGRTTTHAYIVEPLKNLEDLSPEEKKYQIKNIYEVGDSTHLIPQDVLRLCRWASDYYFAPLGEVLLGAVSAASLGLKAKRTHATDESAVSEGAPASIELNLEQQMALEGIYRAEPSVTLLQGVTGSGKTEVYIEAVRRTLSEGRGAIILAPEIALTPQLYARFSAALGTEIATWHSAVSEGKRREQWMRLQSGNMRVVVGARSAVFAPVQNLGLIIVDEEHDPTYKQEDRVRYNARDLSVVRAKFCGARVILGSATPSLETLERVRSGRYSRVRLLRRALQESEPKIEWVDLRTEIPTQGTQAVLSERAITRLREEIDAGNQVLVFLNRRGFASFLVCKDCGHVPECENCSISLAVHLKQRKLKCHTCGHAEPIPLTCSKCSGLDLTMMGAGTESLEQDLPRLIPGLKPIRLDRDRVTSERRLNQLLRDFRERKANALLGTQMLVKGHDFPGVTLVLVVLADTLFRWPDFRAPERAYQILKQVSGRAGRGSLPGTVLVQTYNPDHPVLCALDGRMEEEKFLESERELREALGYPPFGRLARLRIEDSQRAVAEGRAREISEQLAKGAAHCEILGPSEAFVARVKRNHRFDLLLKAPNIQSLQRTLHSAKKITHALGWPLLVDVDPSGLG